MATLEQLLAEKERRLSTAPPVIEPIAEPSRLDSLLAEKQRRTAKEPEIESFGEGLELGVESLKSGATFGLSDEIEGALGAIIAGNFGGEATEGRNILFGEDSLFQEGKDIKRARQKGLRDKAPIASTILEVAGSIPTGGGLFKGITAGTKALNAGRVTQAATGLFGTGVIAGAGFSDTDEVGATLEDAVQGGALSLATAGALNGLIRGGGHAASKIKRLVKDRKYSQAEKFLAKSISQEEAIDALAKSGAAKELGVDIGLAQAARSPDLDSAANLLRRSGASSRVAAKEVARVAEEISKAEGRLLTRISPEQVTPFEGANAFSDGLGDMFENMIKARKLKASPFYQSAFTKNISDKSLVSLNNNPSINSAIKSRGDILGGKIKVNSVKFLNEVKQELDDEISNLTRDGRTTRAGIVRDAKDQLIDEIDKVTKNYKKALKSYSNDSDALDDIFGRQSAFGKSKKSKTILGRINDIVGDDAVKGVNNMFSAEPEVIARTKRIFAAHGKDAEFNAGVKAFVSDKIERAAQQNAPMASVFKSTAARNKLKAAIGDVNEKGFQGLMDIVDNFKDFGRALGGSATTPLDVTRKGIQEAAQSKAGKALSLPLRLIQRVSAVSVGSNQTLDDLIKLTSNPKFEKELTNLLFSEDGATLLKKIAVGQVGRSRDKAAAEAVGVIANRLTSELVSPPSAIQFGQAVSDGRQ